ALVLRRALDDRYGRTVFRRCAAAEVRNTASTRVFVVVPLAADIDHAFGRGGLHHRHALEGRFHEVDPDRQAQAAAGFAVAERAGIVVSHPDDGDQGRLKTVEPGVDLVVGGAGL